MLLIHLDIIDISLMVLFKDRYICLKVVKKMIDNSFDVLYNSIIKIYISNNHGGKNEENNDIYRFTVSLSYHSRL